MDFLTSKAFWVATAERALKTLAQTLLGLITADQFDVLNPDFKAFFFVVLVPTLISVLTSVGSGAAPVGPKDSPSLTNSV